MKTTKIIAMAVMAATFSVAATSWAHAYSGEVYTVCKLDPNGDNFLAFRSCSSSKCRMKRKLKSGQFLLTHEPKGVKGWREVLLMKNLQDNSYAGQSGWVFAKYICKVQY
ncbi:MAG: hypothetical protein COC23_07415 [Hyphomicrobiales bacterium]|nr:MAG: hypothetical protein COC23_07415 [Hyphomicrobiales bacterium]